MIKKNKSTSLIISLTFLIFLPLIQKQWLNLYLFNINDISIYSILYYLSGTICPSFISFNSLNNFTYYKFNENKINFTKKIKGQALLVLVLINLIFLSYLILDYFYINFDLITNLFLERIKLQQLDIFQLSFFIFLISIFLIFRKSRALLKKIILVNFILISFFIWYMQINNIKIDDQFHIYKYYPTANINLINVFNLIAIEISYFTWSFLSYKSNLSDWTIYINEKGDIIPLLKILIFYLLIIIYYSILT